MATQPKVNPTFVNEARHFNGKSVTAVTVDAGSAILTSAEYGPGYAVDAILQKLQEAATPILMSAIAGDQSFDVYFEGDFTLISEFESATASGLTFVEWLEDNIQAIAATHEGTADLSSTTVVFNTGEDYYGLVGETARQ